MKSRRSTIFRVIIVLLGVVLISLASYDLYTKKKVESILKTKDNTLVNYTTYKTLALDSMKLLTMYNEEKYEETKTLLASKVSEDMRGTYFPLKKEVYSNFTKCEIINIVGEQLTDTECMYKIEVALYSDSNTSTAMYIIGVKNGIIYKLERLF